MINNAKVKRRTGVDGPIDMMAYTITICNGDLEIVSSRRTLMMWFEE